MNRKIIEAVESIEANIARCEILADILNDRLSGNLVDYDKYLSLGYRDQEIRLGAELVDLYLRLKEYIEKVGE